MIRLDGKPVQYNHIPKPGQLLTYHGLDADHSQLQQPHDIKMTLVEQRQIRQLEQISVLVERVWHLEAMSK